MTAELEPQYVDSQRALELMTVNEVAALLRASPSWVYRRTYDKHDPLPCLKLHGAVRFRLADIEAWLDAHQRALTPPPQPKWGVVLGKPRVK
ncbi:MAG: Helix-turn-helix domain [Nocardioidaceae bacterium]|jgi:predicted DNA-binding transcriptional regulator AlpA|nr:Helix-turn-helix domain [Nocardioidaceae bacterium]MDX6308302.1 Helix-turn-helix domain [Nocardioidaceae bacterium]